MQRLRLAWLTGTWPAPSETFLAREVAGLRALGHEVRVVALQPGPVPDPVAWYRGGGLGLDGVPAGRLVGGLATPGLGRCLAAITACARRRPRLAARWLRNLPFAAALAGWCADESLGWLHAAWSGLPAQIAWFARQLGGPGYSVAAHAQDVFCAPEAGARALLEAAGVAVCNRAAARALRRRLPQLGDRLAWLPHGLPLSDWIPRECEPDGAPVVLAVGRLVPKKGFDTALRALAGWPGISLEVCGDGPAAAAWQALAGRLGVTVAWRGAVEPPAVREALGRATALVLPSRVDPAGDRDGLANVLLEALAVGVPVVTTAAGSATDIVVPGETGLLVPPDDPAALAAALRRLVADPAARARLAAAGRRAVVRGWSAERNHARLARWLGALAAAE